ncbi:hypothetical protein [Burkholderia stagnalis]|uniref:hypothetical protein n=1 Tax=Burkholderia stagnalis TaxID=1503054 RepID=UPI00075597EF|nr:hypothetical protein [Burkholderia stagnalis]KWI31952.1 hypothetical protein WT71_10415 [Burkholderia stagnalis]KWI72858.1 hypothetical protein WT73_11540 [Burkholderia stagnalis]MDY7806142.1 hypothetical protein [Burkholderia stagnalis]
MNLVTIIVLIEIVLGVPMLAARSYFERVSDDASLGVLSTTASVIAGLNLLSAPAYFVVLRKPA